jgi:ADP-heptose:LPS heptosyltransferase
MLTNYPVNRKASPASTILAATGIIDDYLEYPLMTRNPAALLRLRQEIAGRRFDIAFALAEARGRSKSIRDWLFLRSCGIRRVIGSSLRQRELAYLPVPGGELYEPEALRLVRRVGAEGQIDLTEDRWWDLCLTSMERAAAAKRLQEHHVTKGFIALCLGTKIEVKDWTLPNWRRLVGELRMEYSHLALIGLGVAEERQKTDEVLRLWPGRSVNFCGALTPRVSAALLERATLFLGHDSGPMHLAAAVGTKCVVIFSARIPPGVWFPRGQGHQVLYHRTECFNCGLSVCRHHGKKCILGISVEEVLGAVSQLLKQGVQIERRRPPSHAEQKDASLPAPA